jgi:hypothetical protein
MRAVVNISVYNSRIEVYSLQAGGRVWADILTRQVNARGWLEALLSGMWNASYRDTRPLSAVNPTNVWIQWAVFSPLRQIIL